MSRSRKILALVTSSDPNLLDLPKFESTKGTPKEEREIASKIFNDILTKKHENEDLNIQSIEEKENAEPLTENLNLQFDISNSEEREIASKIFNEMKNHENNHENEDLNIQSVEEREMVKNNNFENEYENLNLRFDISDSEDLYCSSGSEYIPDSDEYNEVSVELNEKATKENQSIESSCSSVKTSLLTDNNVQVKNNVDGVIVSFGKCVPSSSVQVEQYSNSRPWTKKTSCPYCCQDVTHFPRHLQRNHNEEGAVKELFALSIKDPKRTDILNAIRRQGNFASTSLTNNIRPIRRPKGDDSKHSDNLEHSKEQYIVCQDCLGYFKRNYLRRHRNKCTFRSNLNISHRENHLSTAQLFSICSGNQFYSKLRLKNEVFPIMRNDEISNQAMKDLLICCYAESLLNKHKRIQIRNVISNKMRELGRLLLSLKNTTGIQTLFEYLKPQFFDNFISATKIISGFDPETLSYKTNSLPIHMGTTLKQVCDVATKMIIKKSPLFPCNKAEETLKEIKLLKKLIETSWNCEISSLALKNLNERRNQKTKLLPLTEDVIKFQTYLKKTAEEACTALEEKRQIKLFYRRLSECILSLTLLLNRKRIGEIQFIKLKRYYETLPQNQQEEFYSSLTDSEKILAKTFKRIVTEGKGSKPVAILFPASIQKYIEVLMSVRILCVDENNEYLFANPNTKNKWISGYHTLKKLATESGVTDTSLFTSTRLRKQIATILQVLHLTQDEIEQFSNFMGHTVKTHESYYRLPQNIYQTAKVSKLLLAINSGKGALYKGKNLDDIELSDVEDSDDEKSHSGVEKISDNEKNDNTDDEDYDIVVSPQAQIVVKKNEIDKYLSVGAKKKKIMRLRWTEEQKKLLKSHFEEHIKKKIAPKKDETKKFIEKYKPMFDERNWVTIKAFVYNCYK